MHFCDHNVVGGIYMKEVRVRMLLNLFSIPAIFESFFVFIGEKSALCATHSTTIMTMHFTHEFKHQLWSVS